MKVTKNRAFASKNSVNVTLLWIFDFFTFTVFWCEVSCKKCWSYRSHGNSLVSCEPDPYIYITISPTNLIIKQKSFSIHLLLSFLFSQIILSTKIIFSHLVFHQNMDSPSSSVSMIKAAQESARKDIERAFRVLKARWAIIYPNTGMASTKN